MKIEAIIREYSLLPFWFDYLGDRNGERLSHGEREEIERWCLEQFGPPYLKGDPFYGEGDNEEIPRWEPHRTLMCIRDRADAAAFRLRWC